jgi:hypothetical protein
VKPKTENRKLSQALGALLLVGLVIGVVVYFLSDGDHVAMRQHGSATAPPESAVDASPALRDFGSLPPAAPGDIVYSPTVAAEEERARAVDSVGSLTAAVPGSRAWDGLYSAASDLTFGTMTQEKLINVSLDLIAQLPIDAVPQIENGKATYELLDSPAFGKAKLVVDVHPNDEASGTRYSIQASLNTQPGAYTGNPDDNARTSRVEIDFDTDGNGAPSGMSMLAQHMVQGTAKIWDQLSASGKSYQTGGSFNVNSDSTKWYPFTVRAAGTKDEPAFTNRIEDGLEMPGSLADPRMASVSEAFSIYKGRAR